MSFRDEDFDPETYAVGSGLPGMLWRALQQQSKQQGADSGSSPDAAAAAGDSNSQGVLPAWLRTSQMQQSQYRPASTDGIDFDALTPLITGHESGNRPAAKNDKSTATGPGQFIADTWLDILKRYRPEIQGSREQLLALRSNPVLASDMTKAYAQDNAKKLRDAGLPVTFGSLYLAHFAGPGIAKAVLLADPSAAADTIFKAGAMNANPFLKGMNAGDVRAWADKNMADQARAVKAQKAAAFQRAFSTPQQPPPFTEQSGPDFGVAPQQAPQPPIRRLVGRPAGSQSWPLNPAPIAAQAGAGIVNSSGGLPQQPMIGLFSGKPMRYWGLPIFDARR